MTSTAYSAFSGMSRSQPALSSVMALQARTTSSPLNSGRNRACSRGSPESSTGAWPSIVAPKTSASAGVDGGELLERDGHAELAVAEAAELLRDDQAGQTEVVALLDQVPVEVGGVGLVEGADRRCDPLLAPAADLLLEGRDVRRDGGEGGDVERRVERGGHVVTALRR